MILNAVLFFIGLVLGILCLDLPDDYDVVFDTTLAFLWFLGLITLCYFCLFLSTLSRWLGCLCYIVFSVMGMFAGCAFGIFFGDFSIRVFGSVLLIYIPNFLAMFFLMNVAIALITPYNSCKRNMCWQVAKIVLKRIVIVLLFNLLFLSICIMLFSCLFEIATPKYIDE